MTSESSTYAWKQARAETLVTQAQEKELNEQEQQELGRLAANDPAILYRVVETNSLPYEGDEMAAIECEFEDRYGVDEPVSVI